METTEQLRTETTERVNDSEIESSYGSDFGSDEEALLNELLARASTTSPSHQPNTTTQTAASGEEQAQVEESLAIKLQLTDIEDYESPREVRLPKQPKVFGKGALPSLPDWKKGRIQSEYQSWSGTAVG
jgi:hypothetical protein